MQSETQSRERLSPEESLEAQIANIQARADEHIATLRAAFALCESPIEQLFLLEYTSLFQVQPAHLEDTTGAFLHNMPPNGERKRDSYVFIEPQVKIRAKDSVYRADFFIWINSFVAEKWQTVTEIVVEIDGHDYHERTKEQARRDRSRDRKIMSAGITVLRFTGSEVYANPQRAVFELSDFIARACL